MNDTDRSTTSGPKDDALPLFNIVASLAVPFYIAFKLGHVEWAAWPAMILAFAAGGLGIAGWWARAKPRPETRADLPQPQQKRLPGFPDVNPTSETRADLAQPQGQRLPGSPAAKPYKPSY